MRFVGTLVDRREKVEIKDVSGFVDVNTGADFNWDGFLNIPEGAVLETGETYLLVIDEGRSGEILIQEILSQPHKAEVATFLGLGPPPLPPNNPSL